MCFLMCTCNLLFRGKFNSLVFFNFGKDVKHCGKRKCWLLACFQIFALILRLINSLPNDKFLDSSKLKEFADNNLKFDENGRRFTKRVENTVGKGEVARYDQFLLFSQCFQKTFTADTEKPGLV